MKLHVFYNGTDSNYDKDFKKEGRFIHGEIVSRFGYYTQTADNQAANVLRIHGVGGSKDDGNMVTSLTGTALGVRMRSDVQSIVSFVMDARLKQKTANQKGGQVDANLVVTFMGWSRGGIGCIYGAHMVSKVWDELEKNDPSGIKLDIKMIAFDPVSGLGTNVRALDLSWLDVTFMAGALWLSHYTGTLGQTIKASMDVISKQLVNWWELPAHVSQFHGFYAHDERSVGFAPTMPTMTGAVGTRDFNLYGVPGTHSTLVGNLYPDGGGTGGDGPSPVGLHVYRSVVKKAGDLMTAWGVTFSNTIYADWLKGLDLKANFAFETIVVPSSEALTAYKGRAQNVAITFNNPLSQGRIAVLTDGRGVYIGGNKQDRKWKPESSIVEFMNEKNTKSALDSVWQMVVGSETKLEKLGGNVAAHAYNRTGSNWQ